MTFLILQNTSFIYDEKNKNKHLFSLMKALILHTLFYLMSLDIIDSKTLKPPPQEKKNKNTETFFSITSCTNLESIRQGKNKRIFQDMSNF